MVGRPGFDVEGEQSSVLFVVELVRSQWCLLYVVRFYSMLFHRVCVILRGISSDAPGWKRDADMFLLSFFVIIINEICIEHYVHSIIVNTRHH